MSSTEARDKLIASFSGSTRFGLPHVFAKPIDDWEKTKRYCLKELTPQGKFGTDIFRYEGSHRLPGGGDRVRVSPDLRASLERQGRIPAFTRKYAARRKPDPAEATIH